jgi:colanic acid/amylovoran biosynthesis protein
MRIAIIDAYHDSDRGGAGILSGLLEMLQTVAEELDQTLDIGIVYRFSQNDLRFATASRHTSRAYPKASIYSAPLSTTQRAPGIAGWSKLLVVLLVSLLKLALPTLSRDPAVRVIAKADIVISKGGHFYRSYRKGSVQGALGAYLSFYTLLLALRLRKKVYVLAHSFGPFTSSGSRKVATAVLSRVHFLSTRESESRRILSEIGISTSSVEVLPDTAFALMPTDEATIACFLEEKGLKKRQFALITALHWSFPELELKEAEEAYTRYLDEMAHIADHLITSHYVEKVVLAVHNDGQHAPSEDDSKPVTEIYDRIQHKEAALVICDDLSPAFQAGFYGQARVVVGTRMHSVIFALVGGAPAIAISYTHKTDGIMRMVGLADYVLDIASISWADALTKIGNLLANEKSVAESTTHRVSQLRSQLRQTLGHILRENYPSD